jgi:polysaccharide biosynthesis protein PslJ
MLAALGPVITFAAVLALLAGLYILTNLEAALYGMIAVMALLPFGTLPFSIGFHPHAVGSGNWRGGAGVPSPVE